MISIVLVQLDLKVDIVKLIVNVLVNHVKIKEFVMKFLVVIYVNVQMDL